MHASYDPTLRSLDAASTLSTDQRRRADELLERIVATPHAPARAERKRAPRRLVVGAGIAAAVAVAAFALRDTSDSGGVAYASWTAVPSGVAAHDLDAVVSACREQLDDRAIPVALAERRGDFVAVLFHKNNPDISAACVARNRSGTADVDDVWTSVGGSSGPAWTPAAGRITQGMIATYAGDPPAAFTDGAVGRGVVGVTIHAGTQSITATVENGRYAAWWPGRAFADAPPQPSGKGGPEPLLTYDVRLADGTLEKNVAPALPR